MLVGSRFRCDGVTQLATVPHQSLGNVRVNHNNLNAFPIAHGLRLDALTDVPSHVATTRARMYRHRESVRTT